MVADGDVARERGVVDENDVVADLAVMGDMRPHHQQAVRADSRDEAPSLGAGIDGHVLADDGVRSDVEAALLAVIFLVLRDMTDGGEGKHLAGVADRRSANDRDMRMQHDATAELDLRSDNAERPDRNVGAEVSVRVDHGGRMNVGHARNFEL